MKMRGVQPPPLGSVSDRVMTRMYMMEQLQQHEAISTIGMLLASVSPADKRVMGNIRGVLAEHRKSVAFGSWSNAALAERASEANKSQTDEDILKKVEALGGMHRGK